MVEGIAKIAILRRKAIVAGRRSLTGMKLLCYAWEESCCRQRSYHELMLQLYLAYKQMDEQGMVLAVQFMLLKKNFAVPAKIPGLATQFGKLGKAPRLLHRLFGLGAAAEEPPFILPRGLKNLCLGGPLYRIKIMRRESLALS